MAACAVFQASLILEGSPVEKCVQYKYKYKYKNSHQSLEMKSPVCLKQ